MESNASMPAVDMIDSNNDLNLFEQISMLISLFVICVLGVIGKFGQSISKDHWDSLR